MALTPYPYADNRGPLSKQVRVVATTNLASAGPQTIDGVTVVANDLVLLTAQTSAAENGLFFVQPNHWARPEWASKAEHYRKGQLIHVREGTAGAGRIYKQETGGTIVLGTTALVFTETSLSGAQLPEMVSVGAAHGTTVAVAFKIVDGLGADVAAVTPFTWWLSSSATTGVIHGTAPDGNVTFTTGSKLADHTADLFGEGITDASGDAGFDLVHAAGAQDYYLWLRVGESTVVSTKIEIT